MPQNDTSETGKFMIDAICFFLDNGANTVVFNKHGKGEKTWECIAGTYMEKCFGLAPIITGHKIIGYGPTLVEAIRNAVFEVQERIKQKKEKNDGGNIQNTTQRIV